MIELMLQAERALSMGMVDRAEQLYWQAIETDSRNSIAIVGLAKIAIERGDDGTALLFAHKALEIDPDNGAAQRIAKRLEESAAERGLPAKPPPPEIVAAVEAAVPSEPAEAEPDAEAELSAAGPAAAKPAETVAPPAEPADEPADQPPPPAKAARSKADVEWPAADLDQARRGTLPPVPPTAGSGASTKPSVPEWPGADAAPGSGPADDRGGRGKDRA